MKFIPDFTNPNNSLILLGYNDKGEIVFRASNNPAYRQVDKPEVHKGICYLGLYKFDAKYLRIRNY